ncbi:MAG: type I DNA topoisomerase [Candidatus Marinamargulisbacteria bacterium]
MSHLVIVESPAKAKTIEKYLGSDYKVLACYGHVRDLPSDSMGVDLATFKPEYEVLADKKKLITDLKKQAKASDCVWLATDPDREGEAIAWHVQEALSKVKVPFKRIVFNEITKSAVLAAINDPRDINHALVNAQQARRILDRVVGYEMSPILWKKLRRGLSAGRVQSVAVRLIVEKEKEIQAFEISDSYKVTAEFRVGDTDVSADFSTSFDSKEAADKFLQQLEGAEYKIDTIDQKESKRSPRAPFTTSSLQQEASSRLGYSVSKTMTLAQRLYEAGHITYMRTDGTTLSADAMSGIKKYVAAEFGDGNYVPRNYQTKVKGAQEAHEAIRPSAMHVTKAGKDDGEERLYQLIWQRTIASQMADAILLKTDVSIPVNGGQFTIKGEVVSSPGFLSVYPTSAKDKVLPDVSVGQVLGEKAVVARQRFSKPPARFTEASLVRAMEDLGIGRPSTYAPTITTIQKREYVERIESEGGKRDVIVLTRANGSVTESTVEEGFGNDKGKLQPTDIGILVTDYLVGHFDRVMNYQFTAEIESEFDAILTEGMDWTDMLKRFYARFHPKIESAEEDDERINEERHLGDDPDTGKPIYAKIGRYGPFVQLGDNDDEDKRSISLKKGLKYTSLTFEEALDCLAYPIDLGEHNGEPVTINIGRYGIYLKNGSKNYSMKGETVENLEQAIELIKAADAEKANREIHVYDHDGEPLNVLNGRYGPYISHKKKNYKIPKDKDPKSLTLEDCLTIISEAPKKTSRRRKK